MGNRWLVWAVLNLACACSTFGAQTFVAFGLTNVTIGEATYTPSPSQGVFINNLGSSGTNGLSIELGAADSGVFVYPATDGDPANGSFMAGNLYGSVNGQTNRLICFMRCHEQTDGYHPVAIDFSSLGPTHLTFQAFRSGALIAQTEPQPGPMVVYGDYFTPYFPRVNPFWRMPDGSIGALIEFSTLAEMSLPGIGDVSADRVFIRADNPTNIVDFASRLDITARLPYFEISDARLGVFRRPHRALGDAHLHALPGILQVSNLGTNEDDGLAIELDGAVRFDLAFTPIQLPTNGLMTIVALGNAEVEGVLGSARIARTEESLEISAHLEPGTDPIIEVYSNGVQVGTSAGTNATLAAVATVIGYEIRTRITQGRRGIVVHLGQSVALTLPDQNSFQGNEIRFTGTGEFALLRMLALNPQGLEEFSIVSETEHPLPVPRLQIVRFGQQLEISWNDLYRAFRLEAAENLGGDFYSMGVVPNYIGDRATVLMQIDPDGLDAQFFRLSSGPVPD